MKLQEVAQHEKFISGELYAKHAHTTEFIKRYVSTTDSTFLYTYKANGKRISYRIYLTIDDFNRDDWKLYQFIGGKMVEYVEEIKSFATSSVDDLPRQMLDLSLTSPGMWESFKFSKERLDKFIKTEEVQAWINQADNIDCNATGGSIPENTSEKENIESINEVGSLFRATCQLNCYRCGIPKNAYTSFRFNKNYELLCGQCYKEDHSSEFNDEIEYMTSETESDNDKKDDGVMQPAEAIRWMRENPGKVIVAVEDDIMSFKWGYILRKDVHLTGVLCRVQELPWCKLIENCVDFFAYTYRIVEE